MRRFPIVTSCLPALFLFGLLSAQVSTAGTIDFESLTRGATLTNQLQSQGIVASSSGSVCNPGKVLNTALADDGVFNFGGSASQAVEYGCVGDSLRFDFVLGDGTATTVGGISLRVGDGDETSESFRVSFFDLSNTLLGSQDFTTFGGSVSGGVTVQYAGFGVHSLQVLGIGNGSGGAVDDLVFSDTIATPEPSTLVLMASALALAAAKLRRKTA